MIARATIFIPPPPCAGRVHREAMGVGAAAKTPSGAFRATSPARGEDK